MNGDMDELLDALITAKQSEQVRQVKEDGERCLDQYENFKLDEAVL